MADPFETLGVEPRYDLDPAALELRHRDLSRALHPDRYVGAPAAERRMALGKAIEVNDAYRVVKDPIRRAEALLRRAGVEVGETGEPKPPPALLMEMMDLREELAAARKQKDPVRIGKLACGVRARRETVVAALGEQLTSAGTDRSKLTSALSLVGELRYLRRFLEEVQVIEEELSP